MTDKSYVVVAIPSKEDYVWKISSEKVPHLTMLYLDGNLDNITHVEEYIQHVCSTMLHRFYLSVDKRDTLGPEDADVLFFDKYYMEKMLEEVRTYLLKDQDLRKAYDAVEQYPSWTPHLTLGYPKTPAKPDERDYPGIGSVCFDRIALWTGDYEGTEFPLKSDDYGDPVAHAMARGEHFLEHYGVRGMKWGVVRQHLIGGAKKLVLPSDDHVKAAVVQGKARIGGVHTLSNKDLQTIIKRMDLEVKFKELKTVKHNQSLIGKGASWAGRVATDILVGTAVSWLRRPGAGTRFSGTSRASGPARKAIMGPKTIDGEVVTPRVILK